MQPGFSIRDKGSAGEDYNQRGNEFLTAFHFYFEDNFAACRYAELLLIQNCLSMLASFH